MRKESAGPPAKGTFAEHSRCTTQPFKPPTPPPPPSQTAESDAVAIARARDAAAAGVCSLHTRRSAAEQQLGSLVLQARDGAAETQRLHAESRDAETAVAAAEAAQAAAQAAFESMAGTLAALHKQRDVAGVLVATAQQRAADALGKCDGLRAAVAIAEETLREACRSERVEDEARAASVERELTLTLQLHALHSDAALQQKRKLSALIQSSVGTGCGREVAVGGSDVPPHVLKDDPCWSSGIPAPTTPAGGEASDALSHAAGCTAPPGAPSRPRLVRLRLHPSSVAGSTLVVPQCNISHVGGAEPNHLQSLPLASPALRCVALASPSQLLVAALRPPSFPAPATHHESEDGFDQRSGWAVAVSAGYESVANPAAHVGPAAGSPLPSPSLRLSQDSAAPSPPHSAEQHPVENDARMVATKTAPPSAGRSPSKQSMLSSFLRDEKKATPRLRICRLPLAGICPLQRQNVKLQVGGLHRASPLRQGPQWQSIDPFAQRTSAGKPASESLAGLQVGDMHLSAGSLRSRGRGLGAGCASALASDSNAQAPPRDSQASSGSMDGGTRVAGAKRSYAVYQQFPGSAAI